MACWGLHPAVACHGALPVTPLSLYNKFPSALSIEPPEGPYTGFLVITDEEAEAQLAARSCWGWGAFKSRSVKKLPFPQDKLLNVTHSSEFEEAVATKVWFLPVLDKPLSLNCYYVIKASGRHQGKAWTCSRESDMSLCCLFNSVVKDVKGRTFDHRNIYQQFRIYRHHGKSFFSKSLVSDGFPPKFLRTKGWEVKTSRKSKSKLSEALGLDPALRVQLPSFNFPISRKTSSSIIVGKWCCPFIFVREVVRKREQMERTRFYTMTLEQHWEEIYTCENENENGMSNTQENAVFVNMDVNVKREVDLVFGMEALKDGHRVGHGGGFVWYRAGNGNGGRRVSVGLSVAIVEKMKWVLEEGGWVDGEEKVVRVEKRVEIRSGSRWRRFGCYVLVESFVLRRLDGSLVMRCEFRHTHRIKGKCE